MLDQPPSAATHAVLEALVDVALPRDLQVLASKAWDRQLAAMSAVAAAARVAATVCSGGPDEQDDADAELALALRRTDAEMAYQLHQDRQLLTLPFSAGCCGPVSARHGTCRRSSTSPPTCTPTMSARSTRRCRRGPRR